MMPDRHPLRRILFAVLLAISLLGGLEIALVHPYAHLEKEHAALADTTGNSDHNHETHACVTCLTLGGLLPAPLPTFEWLAVSLATEVLQLFVELPAPACRALLAFHSRAPPLL
jgi:hypothetical protein